MCMLVCKCRSNLLLVMLLSYTWYNSQIIHQYTPLFAAGEPPVTSTGGVTFPSSATLKDVAAEPVCVAVFSVIFNTSMGRARQTSAFEAVCSIFLCHACPHVNGIKLCVAKNTTARERLSRQIMPARLFFQREVAICSSLQGCYGSMSLQGCHGSMSLQGCHGSMSLQGCHGSMSLQGCHGYMSLQGCHGSMSLQGCHGSMSLQGCHGSMSLQGCHGSMSLQGCHGSMSLQGCHGYMSLQGCHGSMSYHRTFLKGSACSECFIISQQKHAGPLPPHSTLHTRTHTHTHTHTHTAGRKHDCGQRLSGKRDVSSSYPGVMFHQPCLSHWLSYQSWCLKFVPRCDVSSAVSKSLIVSSVVMSQVRTQVWCLISRV